MKRRCLGILIYESLAFTIWFCLKNILKLNVVTSWMIGVSLQLMSVWLCISWIRFEQYIHEITPVIQLSTERMINKICIVDYKELKKLKQSSPTDVLYIGYIGRSLYIDKLIVERFYSLLSKNGTIEIVLGNLNYSKRVTVFCYPLLHDVTLVEHGWRGKILFWWKTHTIRLLGGVLMIGRFLALKKSNHLKCAEALRKLDIFASERNFNIKLIYNNFSKEQIKKLEGDMV